MCGRYFWTNDAEDALEEDFPELVGQILQQADSLRERVSAARIELKDVEYEAAISSEKVRFSPERLQEVDDRLSLLYGLMRKHGVSTLEALVAIRDSIALRLDDASSLVLSAFHQMNPMYSWLVRWADWLHPFAGEGQPGDAGGGQGHAA